MVNTTEEIEALLRKLFEKHVPANKHFQINSIMIKKNEGENFGDQNNWYVYQHDGVIIDYHGFNTWRRDDFDYFTEITVKVNGVVIHSST